MIIFVLHVASKVWHDRHDKIIIEKKMVLKSLTKDNENLEKYKIKQTMELGKLLYENVQSEKNFSEKQKDSMYEHDSKVLVNDIYKINNQ